ncbi:MAG: DNA mismatch repair endonuclease MutL [Fluviicola sp.]|nr:DNA mismatch repair endonuclease MutL [Fluviicola sp.]
MSDLIRLLPDHIANQIAAGEVVQRPASVVKELIENSIDAGASKIEVFVKDAGRTLIHIVDNGKGLSPLDARMCFERHATSKIQHADDLFALTTKGFRGEALASIAAIAHVTLKTRRATDELGIELTIEGSSIMKQEPVQCAVGASFEVRNLFYNVPARRNFLKSDNVELKHVLDEFERVALAHADLSFKLVHNDQEIYHLLPGPMRKRIVDVFGKQYNDKLVPVTESTDIVRIEGFVGKPEAARKSRGEQFFFVNNRFFRDTYFNHAVNSAFEQLLPGKSFPSYFLFLEVDPKQIDVNVHPTKTEIKFEEDKAIYSILKSAIRLGLGKFNISPTLDFDRESEFDLPLSFLGTPAVEPTIRVDKTYNPFDPPKPAASSSSKSFSNAMTNVGFGKAPSGEKQPWEHFWNTTDDVLPELEPDAEQTSLTINDTPTGPFLIKGTFIVAAIQEGLLLIHFRRAQERLLYEEMMRGFYVAPLASQQLLFPMEKQCSKQEKLSWEEHQVTLQRIGFSWEWKDEQLQLTGIPDIISESTVLQCVDKVLEQLQQGTLDKGEIAHTVLSQLAFAGSMHLKLNPDQASLNDFVSRLFEQQEHQFTPSGKRILNTFSNESMIQLF